MLCKENTNSEAGVARKLASLGSMFNYFIKHEMVDKNPCANVDKPKIHNQEIVVLTPDEINRMLDTVQFGSKSFTPKQESYLSKTRFRDYVMISLMLTTGIRVSELVGLDLDDFFLDEYKMVVRRKGGDRTSVYLSDETCDLLKDYINIRKENKKVGEGEKALFLSLQGKRICVQAVEDMVKKYTVAAGINKPITPHKFRKTFGTELYRETNDIYLVADALNHKSVTTTTKFYAAQSQENLKQARNIMKLNIKKEPRE
jgi:site-specific recombinase XerD